LLRVCSSVCIKLNDSGDGDLCLSFNDFHIRPEKKIKSPKSRTQKAKQRCLSEKYSRFFLWTMFPAGKKPYNGSATNAGCRQFIEDYLAIKAGEAAEGASPGQGHA
jgi:hypothetical protein